MRIGGFQRLSLVDFPGLIASTIFTQGCNFRCGYCHNHQLVFPESFQAPLPVEPIFEYLQRRQGQIEGVVISGGEPTLQPDLQDFILRVKRMGFAVKLDTNGSHPQVLRALIKERCLDYIAMDVKTSFEKYSQITGAVCDILKLRESIDVIINSGVGYQLRTTLVEGFCSKEDLDAIRLLIKNTDHYVLQPFVSRQS